jgi:DNA-binding CsgD family transcriptional regulator
VPPRSPEIPADDQGLLAALDGALDALAPPAFVVGPSGRILRANGPAHEALGREGTALRRSLAAAVAPGAADPMWDVTPLRRASGAPVGFLAIRRPPSRELAIGDALRIASRRWKLTARQLEVLDLAARGFTNDVIAERLRISKGTVEFHLTAIFDKAGVCNRATLIVRMFELE